MGDILPQACISPRYSRRGKKPLKERRSLSKAECNAFLFDKDERDGVVSSSRTEMVSLVSRIAISAGSAMLLSGGSPIPVAMSCIPIIVPMSVSRLSDSAVFQFLSEDAKNFIKGITYVSVGQGTLAMFDFMFGDLLAGFMKGIFAGLGFYISQMDDGVSLLPSYTVVSFVNGCITMLSAFEQMSSRRTPMFAGVMPLYLNYVHLSQLVHPLFCFAGAYMGWQIIKELRRSGLAQSSTIMTDRLMPPQATMPTVQGRVLSSGGTATPGAQTFAPFTGRGHSLSRQVSTVGEEQQRPSDQPVIN